MVFLIMLGGYKFKVDENKVDIEILQQEISELNEKLNKDNKNLYEDIQKLNKGLSAHHGVEWEDNIKEIKNVTDVEKSIEDYKGDLDSTKTKTEKIKNWIVKRDKEIEEEGLEEIRTQVVYGSLGLNKNKKSVIINKAHYKSDHFNRGDKVLIRNPITGNDIEVSVESFTTDFDRPEVLIRSMEGLMKGIGVNTGEGSNTIIVENISKKNSRKPLEEY